MSNLSSFFLLGTHRVVSGLETKGRWMEYKRKSNAGWLDCSTRIAWTAEKVSLRLTFVCARAQCMWLVHVTFSSASSATSHVPVADLRSIVIKSVILVDTQLTSNTHAQFWYIKSSIKLLFKELKEDEFKGLIEFWNMEDGGRIKYWLTEDKGHCPFQAHRRGKVHRRGS